MSKSSRRGAEAASDRRHVFLISYGRTGSTLLMALLSNHPRVLVRGENNMLMAHFQRAYDALQSKFDADADVTSSPYFGGHLYNDAALAPLFRGFVEKFLAGDRKLDEYRVLGFKEAHYDGRIWTDDPEADARTPRFDNEVVVAELAFLKKLFPDCLLVFNTRDPSEVIRSDFNTGRRIERFAGLNALYHQMAEKHDGLVVDYSDIVDFGPQTQRVFERLGLTPDQKIVTETLAKQQGYSRLGTGARVSRVPYFVRLLPREDISFMDIQSVTLYDSRIAVISGGLIAGRPVEAWDWYVGDARARVVNFKGGNPSEYYASHIKEPEFLNCGFALEVFLPKEIDAVNVSLFGHPALRIQNIAAIEEVPVA
ncbi:MAG TPA: hypothetical protein DHW63_08005 [Hyphomonadaceae bacterium]|nr:hypothetical protein [Hyphomonadaceae bacterium]